MDPHFDTKSEDAKLAQVHEREEEDVARILSDKYNIPYADLSLIEIDSDALRAIPEEAAREAEAAAFAKTAKMLSLAVHNPNNPALAKLKEELAAREFKVREFLVSKKVSSGCSRATPTSHSLQNQKRGVSRRSRNAREIVWAKYHARGARESV